MPADDARRLVHLEQRGDVSLVRLDHPRVNVLSAELLTQLGDLLRSLRVAPPRALVIWGGQSCFSAGVDIAELADELAAPVVLDRFAKALTVLSSFPSVTIAAVNGFALGGGLELALACDFRVVAEDARLGLPEAKLGVIPGGGGTQRLPRLVGPARAKQLILSGRDVTAPEALAMGLADSVVASAELLAGAFEMASQFSQASAPAQAAAKRAIDQGVQLPIGEGLALERRLFDELRRSETGRAGLRGFLERRANKS